MRAWLVKDTLHDDAAAVLLKPSPQDTSLRARATMFNRQTEGDGVAGHHAQVHVLESPEKFMASASAEVSRFASPPRCRVHFR